MAIGQDLLNVPMGDMIREMAFAIADAQLRLDQASMETAEMMGGLKTITDDDGNVTFEDSRIFFGAEYMTVAEALVTQFADSDNEAIANTLNGLTFSLDVLEGLAGTSSTSASATDYAAYMEEAQKALEVARLDDLAKATNIATNINDNRVANASKLEQQIRVPTRISMLELGFSPVFYNFVDTIIEVKISISMKTTSTVSGVTSTRVRTKTKEKKFLGIPFLGGRRSKRKQVSTTSVTGRYSNTYSYSAEGSSLLRTKLVPVPQPAILEERIQALMEAEAERKQAKLEALLSDPVA